MRRVLIFFLGLGTILGFGLGFAHLWHCHQGGRDYGWGPNAYENHVADVCVRATERTLREHEPGPPGPPPPGAAPAR